MNKDNECHHIKIPFFLEVEYYDEYNPETENKIMKSLLCGEDILPGLRVNKMFANCVDKDILVADEIQNDLNHLIEEFEKFIKKYRAFSRNCTIDNCMNKLSMLLGEFSDSEKYHAAKIKKITENDQKPQIDRETERYKAYDDTSNFPT